MLDRFDDGLRLPCKFPILYLYALLYKDMYETSNLVQFINYHVNVIEILLRNRTIQIVELQQLGKNPKE